MKKLAITLITLIAIGGGAAGAFVALAEDSTKCELYSAAGFYDSALPICRRAAQQGDVIAQFRAALLYHQGLGGAQNYPQAAKWFRAAAEQGHTDAPYFLGIMYLLGEGIPKDYDEAYVWLSLGIQNGDEKAKKARGQLRQLLDPDQLSTAQQKATQRLKTSPTLKN